LRYLEHQQDEPEYELDVDTLTKRALLTGFLGGHKFYIGNDNGGAIYFLLTVLGIVFTLYIPLRAPLPLVGKFNLGLLILAVPFIASFTEALIYFRQSSGQLYARYPRSYRTEPVVFVAQGVFLLLLFLPFLTSL
jgi:hypothetical protein